MKIRNGFVSNSSSTSFVITNTTETVKTMVDFITENPQLVKRFNEMYDWHRYTQDQMLEDAKYCGDLYPGDNHVTFGDEDGTVIGTVLDYILRECELTEGYKCIVKKYLR